MNETKTLDFKEFRTRVGDLRGKEFWRSLEELSRGDAFEEFFANEFPQQAVPLEKGVDRRDFVKLMGASVAMAGLAACRQPAEAIIPYVNQPESLIPGKPIFFASAMPLGGAAHRRARRESHEPADEDRGQSGSSIESRRQRRVHAGRRSSASTIPIARRSSARSATRRPGAISSAHCSRC